MFSVEIFKYYDGREVVIRRVEWRKCRFYGEIRLIARSETFINIKIKSVLTRRIQITNEL